MDAGEAEAIRNFIEFGSIPISVHRTDNFRRMCLNFSMSEDGCLVYRSLSREERGVSLTPNGGDVKQHPWRRVVVGAVEKEDIFTQGHTADDGSHYGKNATFKRIKELYWWPALKDDVDQMVKQCSKCRVEQTNRVKPTSSSAVVDGSSQNGSSGGGDEFEKEDSVSFYQEGWLTTSSPIKRKIPVSDKPRRKAYGPRPKQPKLLVESRQFRLRTPLSSAMAIPGLAHAQSDEDDISIGDNQDQAYLEQAALVYERQPAGMYRPRLLPKASQLVEEEELRRKKKIKLDLEIENLKLQNWKLRLELREMEEGLGIEQNVDLYQEGDRVMSTE